MSADHVTINGKQYQAGNQIGCSDVDHKPTEAEIKALIEKGSFDANLQTDIFYYVPGKKQLCHAGVQTTERLFKDLPEKVEEIKEINGEEDFEIISFDRERGQRGLSGVTVDCRNEKIREGIDKLLKRFFIEDGGTISIEQMGALAKSLLPLSLEHGQLIMLKSRVDPEKEIKITIDIKVRPVPMRSTVQYVGGTELSIYDKKMLADAIHHVVVKQPHDVIALMLKLKDLPQVLTGNEEMRGASFTPVFKDINIQEGRVTILVDIIKKIPEIEVEYDEGYLRYLSTRPESEMAEAKRYLQSLKSQVQSPNLQGCLHQIEVVRQGAKDGWKRMERSYELHFERVPLEGRLLFKVSRVPTPTKLVLEGDYPPEHKDQIMAYFAGATEAGKVDLKRGEEGVAKVREFYQGKGYKLKKLGSQITHDGVMHVVVNLRRWDSVYAVNVLGEDVKGEDKKKHQGLISEIMAPLSGQFIKQEDIDAVKRKLARGLSRMDIREVIATDKETDKTRVIFIASKGKAARSIAGGFAGSSVGLFLNASFAVSDNGKGTSWSVAYTNQSRWSFFENWDTKDVFYQSLNLGFGTYIGPNSRISVGVYGFIKNYSGQEQKAVGTDVTFHTYHLNDKLTLSMGGAIEVIDNPAGVDGYTGFPVKFRPHGKVCYKDGDLQVCASSSLTTGSSNYSRNEIYIQYSIPLGGSTEHAPYIVLKGSGGVMVGDTPELEQFYQSSTRMPFAFSFTNGEIHFGRYYVGASAALGFNVTDWFAIKPIVVSAMLVGNYAKVTTGSCVILGPLEFCAGYRKGFLDADDGLDLSLSPSDAMEVPEEVRTLFEKLFLRRELGVDF